MDADEDYEYSERSFQQTYRCYPVSYFNKPYMENGDKIIMPQSTLDQLDDAKHDLERGRYCKNKNCHSPKGHIYEIVAPDNDLLRYLTPKELEGNMRNFSCLTIGDAIMVAHNNQQYYINILEMKPSNVISIIETDCEVDFVPSLDYKQPETAALSNASSRVSEQEQQDNAKVESLLKRFGRNGRRLDGKIIQPLSTSSLSTSKVSKQESFMETSSTSSPQSSSKLLFNSSSNTSKAPEDTPLQKKEDRSFKPFTRRKYPLLD